MMLNLIKKCPLLLLVAAASLPICSLAQLKETPFVIKGDMTAMPTNAIPKKVYLIFDSYLNKTIDSVNVTNGRYTYSGKLTIPANVSIRRLKDRESIIGFVVSPGVQEVVTFAVVKKRDSASARTRNLPVVTIADSSVVRGSVADSIYKQQVMEPAKKEYMALPGRANLGFAGILAKYSQLQEGHMVRAVKEHPDSPIAPMLVIKTANRIDRRTSDTLLSLLPKRIQPIVAKELEKAFRGADAEIEQNKDERLKVGPAIGSKAPVFSMNDTLNNPISLSKFRGKYVLLDFWASWCAPCRMENPTLVKAYREFKAKGLEIIGISLDATNQRDAWIQAIHADGLNWTQLSDLQGWKNSAAQLYGVKSIPQNFLIDPNGVIVDKGLRGNELIKVLMSHLK